MFSKIKSAALLGIKALPVNVEVDISPGLPMFSMVGSLGNEVKESKDRVWAALKNSGLSIPLSRITVNLSPADIHKEGTSYDLPIAIGMLSCSGTIKSSSVENILILGELGLNGEIKPIKGVLPIIREAQAMGIKECIIPFDNAAEGSIVPDVTIRGATHILQVVEYLKSGNEDTLPRIESSCDFSDINYSSILSDDFSDVIGQDGAKRAAVISAAGFHSLLMTGPPGAGKTMIARRIPGIMPPLTLAESLEVTSIFSVAGKLKNNQPLINARSFSNPHHSITKSAMLGGGAIPKPGAISLAHRSVLFLDELTEFDRQTIDSLRQPLEDHEIHINRSRYNIVYPSDFLLICAMNPCPCGYYPDRNRCKCSENDIRRYLGKISGPILDRIDLCVELKAVDFSELASHMNTLSSADMREQVIVARAHQENRFKNTPYRFNSDIKSSDIDLYCELSTTEKEFMKDVFDKLRLSARSYHRILRVSRTIADINDSHDIKKEHLLEALSFRPDIEYW